VHRRRPDGLPGDFWEKGFYRRKNRIGALFREAAIILFFGAAYDTGVCAGE
jgi:hypothetical protein